jgi:hypothetical protein
MPARPDARKELRYAWNRKAGDEVLLRVGGQGAPLSVTLFDVSPNGAGLATCLPLPTGQEVAILLKTNGVKLEFMANVAWCHALAAEDLPSAAPNASGALFGVGVHIRGSGSFLAMLKATPVSESWPG